MNRRDFIALGASGAAAAVARIAQFYGKPFYIVVDRVHCDSPRIVEMLSAEEGYGDAFIDAQSAMVVSNSKSLLVVVDTSRRDYTEAPDLGVEVLLLEVGCQGLELIP